MMCLARDVFIFCLPFFTTVSSMTTRAPTKDGQEHEEIASLPCMPTRGTSFCSPPRKMDMHTVLVYHIEGFNFIPGFVAGSPKKRGLIAPPARATQASPPLVRTTPASMRPGFSISPSSWKRDLYMLEDGMLL